MKANECPCKHIFKIIMNKNKINLVYDIRCLLTSLPKCINDFVHLRKAELYKSRRPDQVPKRTDIIQNTSKARMLGEGSLYGYVSPRAV